MVIIADPYPGATNAIVYDEKNQPIGGTPVDKPFTYYGKYNFRIVKDGYETLDIENSASAPPWYELPGLDFFAENVIPWTIRDVRYYRYAMTPASLSKLDPENLLRDGELLRAFGKTIGAPAIDPSYVVPPPTGTVLGEPDAVSKTGRQRVAPAFEPYPNSMMVKRVIRRPSCGTRLRRVNPAYAPRQADRCFTGGWPTKKRTTSEVRSGNVRGWTTGLRTVPVTCT